MCCPRGEESMLAGLRIVVAGGMYSVGPILEVRYTGGMGDITPVGNVDVFPSASFGWFYPRQVSLLA